MRATLRPAISTSVILAVAVSPIAAIALRGIIDAPLAAWALLCGSAAVVLYTLSVRVDLDDGEITFRRYGRIVWRCELARVAFEDGRVGDFGVGRGIVVTDAHTGEKVGEIISSNFHPDELERFVAQAKAESHNRRRGVAPLAV